MGLAVQARPLPEFMNAQKLTLWRAQHTPTETMLPAKDAHSLFFTGKPLDTTSGNYLFMFRSYNPNRARWNSTDPSGFPDGANNQIYAPVPTHALDSLGLYSAWHDEQTDLGILRQQCVQWRAEQWNFAANLLSHFYKNLAPSSDYTGTPEEAAEIRDSKKFRAAALQRLEALYGSMGLGTYSVGELYKPNTWNPAFEARYITGGLFYALGGAHFWYQGTLNVTKGTQGTIYTFSGTMQQVDRYTFDTWDAGAAAWLKLDKSAQAARDMELKYHCLPFFNIEKWTDTFTWE